MERNLSNNKIQENRDMKKKLIRCYCLNLALHSSQSLSCQSRPEILEFPIHTFFISQSDDRLQLYFARVVDLVSLDSLPGVYQDQDICNSCAEYFVDSMLKIIAHLSVGVRKDNPPRWYIAKTEQISLVILSPICVWTKSLSASSITILYQTPEITFSFKSCFL